MYRYVLYGIFVLVLVIGGISAFPYRGGLEQDVRAILHPQPRAHLLFVGDMMFDRSIRAVAEERGGDFIFSCIADSLQKYDAVVGNLEGPITSNPSVSKGSVIETPDNYTFTFPPETADLLVRHNIRVVNLGNNHMLNFGREGLLETKRHLERAGVRYFGDPDAIESEKVARITIRGVPFSFVNWSDWTSDPSTTSSQGSDGYGAGKTNHTVEQVKLEADMGRVVVVYAHWGEEYVGVLPKVKELARQFVDAGAVIVIGSHPHIVQEHEVYKGRNIYYSLGNFIFDQYFSEEVSHGLTLDVVFEGSKVRVTERPVELLRDRRTCFK